ncbi:peroxiredoxin family protein [Deinococcus malanensis]|uniref:peroxiredoxin family protein n=1 Tax=Deinococcus malanensis TaxID=1706855 RepID=UPI00362D345F
MQKRITLLLFLMSGLASAVRPGDVAPDFTLNDATGKRVTLSSLRGQPVVLTFWATWCLVCKRIYLN